MKNALYWVTNDLRIHDNSALNIATKSDKLLCVYVVDKAWFSSTNFQSSHIQSSHIQSSHINEKRWQFLKASLEGFNRQLMRFNQQLYIVYGDTFSTLNNLCEQYLKALKNRR